MPFPSEELSKKQDAWGRVAGDDNVCGCRTCCGTGGLLCCDGTCLCPDCGGRGVIDARVEARQSAQRARAETGIRR